ncbi:alpha/beta fold hydrolase [Antrihabitans stalactiti]|uniref:Alpha/beta hydrolase n=1 Tax=Antrihabitans stalactiti TaxID=2584121 RepID=A0A848KCM8_9NOCA|nr:alpha/beta hydrolase [Antrihabitans stalactiti]NMN93890.1 alpha/beta hydrolase [Antrihabitans stalactiti]
MTIAAIEGNGNHKVLVLHGWALDSGVWLTARALSDVGRFTFAYVDFPGYGVARDEAPADGIDGMAQAALDDAKGLGWESFSVLGHSMGGLTALRVATLAPQQVRSVVAVTPASPAGTPLDEQTYAAFASAWSDPGPTIKGGLSPNIAAEDLSRLVARNRASMTQAVWDAYLANWTAASFFSELGSLEMPVTLFYGDSDPFITEDYLKDTVNAIPNVESLELKGSGHYPMIEAPAASVPLWERALTK